jgi:hypothetical protein
LGGDVDPRQQRLLVRLQAQLHAPLAAQLQEVNGGQEAAYVRCCGDQLGGSEAAQVAQPTALLQRELAQGRARTPDGTQAGGASKRRTRPRPRHEGQAHEKTPCP